MHTMEIQEIGELIEKTLSGDAGPAEQKALDKWYASFDELPGISEAYLELQLPQQLQMLRERILPKDPKFCLVIV